MADAKSTFTRIASAGLTLAGVALSSASAQDTQTAQRVGLEEVVVTARKRSETVQDIPLSVTAFSAKAIEEAAIFDMRNVAQLSPNVTLQSTGGSGTGRFMPNLTFRGLQNVFPQPRAQVGVVFVDGNYVLGGVNAINTADVERIEVLRGPQNAYFGRNTFAGAINFITKTPGNEFKGEGSFSGTVRGTFDANISADVPLIEDKLSSRISTTLHDKRGHYVAQDGGRLGNEGTKAVSATLYATPSDKMWVRVRGAYQDDSDGPGQVINLSPDMIGDTCKGQRINKGTTLSGQQGFNVSLPYFCGSIPGIDQLGESIVSTNTSLRSPLLATLGNPNGLIDAFLNNSLGDPSWNKAPKPDGMGLKREIRSISIQSQYEFDGGITFAFNYGYDQNYSSLVVDSDRTMAEINYAYIPQFSRTRTIEARLRSSQDQSIRWLIGGTYFNSYFSSNFGNGGSIQYQSRLTPTQTLRSAVLTSLALTVNPYATSEVAHVRGVFGAVDVDLTQDLTITGELRYQSDQSVSGRQLLPTFATVPTSLTFKDFAPRGIAKYKISSDWNVYASWSRGILPGVENTGYTGQTAYRQQLLRNLIPNIQPVLDSDKLDSYEIGSKQTLLDGKLRYSVSAYYMRWKNAKAQTALLLPSTSETNATPFSVTGVTTQGTVEARGLELEASALLTPNWEINGGMSVQKSKFLKWGEVGILRDLTGGQSPGAVAGNVSYGAINWEGNEMQRQPRMTANLNTTYRWTVANNWEAFARGEMTYTGSAWDSTANIVKSDPYVRVNARVGFEHHDFTVEFFVLNLFNDKTWDYISRSAVVDVRTNSVSAILPLGIAGSQEGFAVQAPDKRDFGMRVKYKF